MYKFVLFFLYVFCFLTTPQGLANTNVYAPLAIDECFINELELESLPSRTVRIKDVEYRIVKIIGEGAYGRAYILEAPDGKKFLAKALKTGEKRYKLVKDIMQRYQEFKATVDKEYKKIKPGIDGKIDKVIMSYIGIPLIRKKLQNESLKRLSAFETEIKNEIYRFQMEFESLSYLNEQYDKDPKIPRRVPRVFGDIEETSLGGPTYLMEYLENAKTLHEWINDSHKDGKQPKDADIAKIGIAVAEHLSLQHKHKIAHRDLKPPNIIVVLNPDGSIKDVRVIDYGLVATPDIIQQESQNHWVGTPAYLSPEAWRENSTKYMFQNDLYALGVTLFQVKNNQIPIAGADQQDHIMQVARLTNPNVPRPRPEIPVEEKWNNLFDIFFAADVSNRFRDADQLAQYLKQNILPKETPKTNVQPRALQTSGAR